MEKLIITAALTGGIQCKEANPALPEKPEEIIRDAISCYKAGASVVHIHARNRNGKNTGDPDIYREINDGIRASTPLIVQNTTGGPGLSINERLNPLDAMLDMASLSMGTVVFLMRDGGRFGENVFMSLRSEIEAFARTMLERNIKPELEVYNPSMFSEVENLMEKGLVRKPVYVNLVMNVYGMGVTPER